MKRTLVKTFAIALLFVGVFGGTKSVEAQTTRSATVSNNSIPSLQYYFDGPNWPAAWYGTRNSAVASSVTYKAQIRNRVTGAVISNGATLPVGTKFRLDQVSASNSDIQWSITSKNLIGNWVAGAGQVSRACDPQDRTFTEIRASHREPRPYRIRMEGFWLMSVAPPNISRHINVAGPVSCNSTECTVTGAGPIRVSIRFNSTNSRFYYRFAQTRSGSAGPPPYDCHVSRLPMRVTNGSTYNHTIPAATIQFNLTGEATNRPPNDPVITGPTTGLINTSYTFNFRATDPDNDNIIYLIDWGNNRMGNLDFDEAVPSSGNVPSGTTRSKSRSWPTSGTHTFAVAALDVQWGISNWVTHTITLGTPPSPINGSCGSSNGGSYSAYPTTNRCTAGSVTTLDSFGTDGTFNWRCNGSNGGSDALCFANKTVNPIITSRFTATPEKVLKGKSSTLTWEMGGVKENSCTILRDGNRDASAEADGEYLDKGGYFNYRSVGSGHETVSVDTSVEYTLECLLIDDTPTAPLTVTVTAFVPGVQEN